MSSYNDWDGIPVTGSYYFLTQLLRERFGFAGYIVSDSDAVEFLFTKHHVAKDSADAVVQFYFKQETSSVTVYETQLRGFERVTLELGETKTVRFTLKPRDIAILDKDMNPIV